MTTETKSYNPGCQPETDRQTDRQLVMYLQDAWENDEDAAFWAALKTIAGVKGVQELSRITGINRGYLCKIFNANHSPGYDTLKKILKGLGIKIRFTI